MLQTRVSYTVFVARQRYQREILRWSCNQIYITCGIQQTAALETAAKNVTPCFAFD